MAIKKETYKADKNILIAPECAVGIGCIVGNEGITANAEGRKIIKAGTPVGSTVNVLENRQTVLTAGDTNAQGVVLHDADVTDGNQNATLVIKGIVDLLKLDVVITEAAKTKLTNIIFMKGVK